MCVQLGSGADLWGSEGDSRYGKPRIDDGMLEVLVGVTGVVHMVSSSPTALTYLFPYSVEYHVCPDTTEKREISEINDPSVSEPLLFLSSDINLLDSHLCQILD